VHCADVLAAGPPAWDAGRLEVARYHLTDQVDDLLAVAVGAPPGPVAQAVAVEVWRQSAELLLATGDGWHGGGKWLARELLLLDGRRGTDHAHRLAAALGAALAGDPDPLVGCAEDALATAGGRLRDGWTQAARLPPDPA
jgi:hypothetical protein